MNQFAPANLCDLLQQYIPKRVLRSATKELPAIPKTKSVNYGDRAFSVADQKTGTDYQTLYVKHKHLTVLKTIFRHFSLEKLFYDEYCLNLYFLI